MSTTIGYPAGSFKSLDSGSFKSVGGLHNPRMRIATEAATVTLRSTGYCALPVLLVLKIYHYQIVVVQQHPYICRGPGASKDICTTTSFHKKMIRQFASQILRVKKTVD